MRRRDFLGAVSVPAVVSLGGCQTLTNIIGGSVRLGAVVLENHDPDSTHQFDIRVERGGKTVHSGRYTVPASPPDYASGMRLVNCTWDDEPGQYAAVARVDGGSWEKYEIQDEGDADCLVCSVQRIHPMEGSAPPKFGTFAWCGDLDETQLRGEACTTAE